MATATPTKPAKSGKTIRTKIVVASDTGRASAPRVRNYDILNRDTGQKLGVVVEVWKTGEMEYKNSVKEGRRSLSATDAKGKELGKDFQSRALAVAAVRNAAKA